MANKSEWHHLYQRAAWKRLRAHQLATQPLCEFCLITEDVTEADTVDHKKPHKGDLALFLDPANLQSLCAPCHNGHKQRIERGSQAIVIGVDGYPIEIG